MFMQKNSSASTGHLYNQLKLETRDNNWNNSIKRANKIKNFLGILMDNNSILEIVSNKTISRNCTFLSTLFCNDFRTQTTHSANMGSHMHQMNRLPPPQSTLTDITWLEFSNHCNLFTLCTDSQFMYSLLYALNLVLRLEILSRNCIFLSTLFIDH